MSTIDEIKEIPERYKNYRDDLARLFKKHNVDSIKSLVVTYKNDAEFKEEWGAIWRQISEEDGGKLSMTTIGIIIGSAMGGVGIAAMGSAIGVPLALVLGLGGFLSGSKIDSLKFFGAKKRVAFTIDKAIHDRLMKDSKDAGLSLSDFTAQLVELHYAEEDR